MEKNNGKTIALIALFVAVIGLSIGFAAYNAQLTISGTATVKASSWGVTFRNLTESSKTGTPGIATPAELNDTQIGPFSINFDTPGESVVYTFTVANTGSIDAILGTYTPAVPTFTDEDGSTSSTAANLVENEFTYTLTYAETKTLGTGTSSEVSYTSGQAVAQNDILPGNSEITVNLTIGFDMDESLGASELPDKDVTVGGLGITAIYSEY